MSTQVLEGGAGKEGRRSLALEEQREVEQCEGAGQKVGDCQNETGTQQPSPSFKLLSPNVCQEKQVLVPVLESTQLKQILLPLS